MKMRIVLAFLVAAVLIGGSILAFQPHEHENAGEGADVLAQIDGDQQIVEIVAQGGYIPNKVTAKAGMPTTIHLSTEGTFDCSAGVTIPSLGFRTFLEPGKPQEVKLTAQQATGRLQGLCSMGMYSFVITFE